ncbi:MULTISPECIES: 7-carboxy-7-deazaguanine synthase QueE [Azospira]|jgi:7-carboxy-7-deazaguanine synthase|uniref:7-carboxy-7-deazaguanine synthase QueE n=1 Tax=Azospira TaxID=146937 RepID=UPI0011F93B07|nr:MULTISPECIES: 7-carboxy-7-deazaguanine synthase QueE [Azospira]TLS18591.1 MAG: 7-carboxy-7-deazaguanine synthase QueE [Betaproteobacteria bacterium]BBN89039.1 7-carboxy-7-deazaguanine synthase [Azospira sp. I09]
MTAPTLKISEIFYSLQGETSRTGLPTVFVRLTGCPLRCVWCDTAYSFSGGTLMSLPAILAEVARHPTKRVCVSGGEPLAQKNCLPLLTALCDAGCDVSLETSGALDVSGVDPRVSKIVDLKAPGSGEVERNLWSNLEYLTPHDELKLVLADRADYDWAVAQLRQHGLIGRCPILMAPVQGSLEPGTLADWILADGLPVRLQVQLHKLLWGNMRGK